MTELEKEQTVPLDAHEHAELVRRLRAISTDHEWVFCSRTGTPINPGNARRRYLHPAAEAIGIKVGGWHDFRHAQSYGQGSWITARSNSGLRSMTIAA